MFMKNKGIVFLCMILAVTCISQEPIYAANWDYEYENNADLLYSGSSAEIAVFLNTIANNQETEAVKEVADQSNLWEEAISEGYIYMDIDGHFKISERENVTDLEKYKIFESELETWNWALDLQVLKWDTERRVLYTPEITEEIIDNIMTTTLQMGSEICEEKIATRAVGHYCGYDKWNLDATCRQNYNLIKDFYNSMVKAQSDGTNVNPWLSTATYWVGLVREKGLWDYKVQKNYEVFCCTVGGVGGQDRSAEWIGNYNYGYTGKFLFNLDALHTGSLVVAKLDPKDKVSDWPAIDKGYANAP